LSKKYPNEPVLILWSDHLVLKPERFKKVILAAEKLIKEEKNRIIFIGQKARFASDNLGWIEVGEVVKKIDDINFYQFSGFKYKPDKFLAEKYFKGSNYCWNLGYFISTPSFVYSLFKRFSPRIYQLTEKIVSIRNKKEFNQRLEKYYRQMPEINFDNAVLEQLDNSFAYVIVDDIGWSDVGSWEALKEALQTHNYENVIRGKVYLKDVKDSLIYNYESNKLIVGIDLDENIIVNTKDVILIAKKTSMSKVKELVESFSGTDYE
jgi:mannose-1-phosphate guanylyltransferase